MPTGGCTRRCRLIAGSAGSGTTPAGAASGPTPLSSSAHRGRRLSYLLEYEDCGQSSPVRWQAKLRRYRRYFGAADTRADFDGRRPASLFVFADEATASRFCALAARTLRNPLPAARLRHADDHRDGSAGSGVEVAVAASARARVACRCVLSREGSGACVAACATRETRRTCTENLYMAHDETVSPAPRGGGVNACATLGWHIQNPGYRPARGGT